ncbi:MAG: hypothetical protein JWM10_4, partial [Myxococcaceae bacterium]|nr:hypothetical protein [Myxococcaceae bacterium]
MQRHTTLTALAALTLVAAAGCAPVDGDDSASSESTQPIVAATCPETVTLVGRDPRNAAGQIRYCWPGQAKCFCDTDNDCYALAGYVACTPRTATSTSTSTTPTADAGVRDTGVRDSGPADTGVRDAGPADTGVRDAGTADTGVRDSGTPAVTP